MIHANRIFCANLNYIVLKDKQFDTITFLFTMKVNAIYAVFLSRLLVTSKAFQTWIALDYEGVNLVILFLKFLCISR